MIFPVEFDPCPNFLRIVGVIEIKFAEMVDLKKKSLGASRF